MITYVYYLLLNLNFLDAIPQWVEAISLICSGVGGALFFWRKEEQKRLSGLENATNKILDGYDSLIDELQLARREKDAKIDALENENQKLIKQLFRAESLIDKQSTTIEGLKFLNKFISESTDAPDEVRDWLLGSALKEFLDGEQSIREILFRKVESIPDRKN